MGQYLIYLRFARFCILHECITLPLYVQGGSEKHTPPNNMQYLQNHLSDFKNS